MLLFISVFFNSFCFSVMFLVNIKGLWPLKNVFVFFYSYNSASIFTVASSLLVPFAFWSYCRCICTYRACELTLLRPLWQLFMSMENSLSQDPTSVTVLLPLHRALTELFFIAEARATVSETPTQIYTQALKINRPHLVLWSCCS